MSETASNPFDEILNSHLNPMIDATQLSADPRRTGSLDAINNFLSTVYARNALKNLDEFYGVVVFMIPGGRNTPSANVVRSQIRQEGKEDKSVDPYEVYKVYIPELECRPFPESADDAVIATYKDVHASASLLTTVGAGSIVRVRFRNFVTMSGPIIVGVEGAIEGGMMPVLRSDVASAFNTGDKKNVTDGAGAGQGATDAQASDAVDQARPKAPCGGPDNKKCWPKNFVPIPGKNNWRSARIRSYDQVKYLKTQKNITTIINLAADSLWKQKDTRSAPQGPCGIPAKDQRDKGCCDPATYGKTSLRTSRGCGNVKLCQGNCEALWCSQLGIKFIFNPIGGRARAIRWDEIYKALKGGNCLIHCVAGTDRTGAVAGRWMRATDQYFANNDKALMNYVRTTGDKRGDDWDNKNGDPRRKDNLKKWMLAGKFTGPALPRVHPG
ncbi:hypothetical protein [uncultured Mediterranean phage]|nr:hypothetical protein [uncultured Mediterranean phage]